MPKIAHHSLFLLSSPESVESLLAELQPVCSRCDALGIVSSETCASCGAPLEKFPAEGEFTNAPAKAPEPPAPRGERAAWSEATFTAGSGRLVLLRGLGAAGTVFDLRDEENVAGRTMGSITFPEDDSLPPRAATFVYRDGKLLVRDEGGPSGILVRISHQAQLTEGGVFSLGDRLFRFAGQLTPPSPSKGDVRMFGSALNGGAPLIRLESVLLGGAVGRTFLLPSPARLGRVNGDIVLGEDPFISARHCAVHLHEGGAVLQDLGSSNGTFLKMPELGERQLQRGDVLRLGRNILRVE